jgi:DNA-binding MarR family transcriptional regulator
MKNKSSPDFHVTLGALLRHPYERMVVTLYAELGKQGFDEVRPAFSVVLRTLPPAGARVSDLAIQAGMSKQSISYLVDQMVDVDLVEVTPDATDRRANVVKLTSRGEKVVMTIIDLSRKFEARCAAQIGEQKMARLRLLLTELNQHLDAA